MVWSGIAENVSGLKDVFWEHPEITEKLDAFRRVS
jgi:hypothetical protein